MGIRVSTADGEGIVRHFMSGGGGGGEGGGRAKADMFLVELRNRETVLVDGGNISSPVAKVCIVAMPVFHLCTAVLLD